jgi:hypothetical protein
MNLNKIFLLFLSLVLVIVVGCTFDPENFLRNNDQVKDFLNEYPNAEILIIHLSEEQSTNILSDIQEDCGNQMLVKEYYKATIEDSDSGLELVVYLDPNTQIIDCFKKKGSVGDDKGNKKDNDEKEKDKEPEEDDDYEIVIEMLKGAEGKINFPSDVEVGQGKTVVEHLKICNIDGILSSAKLKVEAGLFPQGLNVKIPPAGILIDSNNLNDKDDESRKLSNHACAKYPVLISAKPKSESVIGSSASLSFKVSKSIGGDYASLVTTIKIIDGNDEEEDSDEPVDDDNSEDASGLDMIKHFCNKYCERGECTLFMSPQFSGSEYSGKSCKELGATCSACDDESNTDVPTPTEEAQKLCKDYCKNNLCGLFTDPKFSASEVAGKNCEELGINCLDDNGNDKCAIPGESENDAECSGTTQVACATDVNFQIKDACKLNDQLKLKVANNAGKDIEEMIIRVYESTDAIGQLVTTDLNNTVGIPAFGISEVIIQSWDISGANVSLAKQVEIIPKIDHCDGLLTCGAGVQKIGDSTGNVFKNCN